MFMLFYVVKLSVLPKLLHLQYDSSEYFHNSYFSGTWRTGFKWYIGERSLHIKYIF